MFRTTYPRSKRNGWRTRALLAAAMLVGIGDIPASIPHAVAESNTVVLADLDLDIGGSRTPIPPPTGTLREFELVAAPTRWEILPGVEIDALAYNRQVPGPEIRVTEGDLLRVTLRNELDEPTSIHWHGLHVPNAMDGVPPFTQEAVAPGESFTYEFPVSHAGTFMYHSHVDAAEQIDRGLYGPLVVEPQPANAGTTAFDAEFTMMLGAWNIPATDATDGMGEMPGMAAAEPPAATDGGHDAEAGEPTESLGMQMDYNYFTINGKAFPATETWEAKQGNLIRVRVINISNLVHPMHLHGQDFKVIAKDGEPLRPEQQLVMNTLPVNAGETYDIAIVAESPGAWVFHCHELHHTENAGVEPGGLIQVLEVEPSA